MLQLFAMLLNAFSISLFQEGLVSIRLLRGLTALGA